LEVELWVSKVFWRHRTPDGSFHPENPRRLDIVVNAVRNELGEAVRFRNVELYDERTPLRIHDPSYVERVRRLCEAGGGWIDSDTYVSRDSWGAAVVAATSSSKAVEEARSRGVAIFVATRPPGHHAGKSGKGLGAATQGFCIFNNVACAASRALELGLSPVLIVDFDLHHGNGTQDIFWSDPRVVHFDAHLHGIYPGTGWVSDVGGEGAEGTKINLAVGYGFGDDDYVYAFKELLPPIVDYFSPRAILVSAGFDSYEDDYLEGLYLTERFFRFVGGFLASIARERGAPLVAVLEGGYSVGLSRGLPAFLEGILSEESEVGCVEPSPRARSLVEEVRAELRRYVAL